MLSEEIRQARLARGWTQKELSQRIKKSVSTVSSWERGKTNPRGDVLKELSKILKVKLTKQNIKSRIKKEKAPAIKIEKSIVVEKEKKENIESIPKMQCVISISYKRKRYNVPPLALGNQSFERIIENRLFYVDKTNFIQEWWDKNDAVTLITRPRRFGKTLMMNTIECFFSSLYANRKDLFEGLQIWNYERFQKLQGQYPVILLSFAHIQAETPIKMYKEICGYFFTIYKQHNYLLTSSTLTKVDKKQYNETLTACKEWYFDIQSTSEKSLRDEDFKIIIDNSPLIDHALMTLSDLLAKHYGKKVIILLDEYDTPMVWAFLSGFWDIVKQFFREFFSASFKNNKNLERALMTGVSQISQESLFSALNNATVVPCTSDTFAEYFGFTKEEVEASLQLYGLEDPRYKTGIKEYYDGFHFGELDIYNPYSIAHFLHDNQFKEYEKSQFHDYWINCTSNAIETNLLKTSNVEILKEFEKLLRGDSIEIEIDEHLVFKALKEKNNAVAIWSFLFTNGYLTTKKQFKIDPENIKKRQVVLTNKEIFHLFEKLVQRWYCSSEKDWTGFIEAMLANDIDEMNKSYNYILRNVMSYLDRTTPEVFYHGFTLGMTVMLHNRYYIKSNNVNAFGRYDCLLEPKDKSQNAYIIEFKAIKVPKKELFAKSINEALDQIEDKVYYNELLVHGFREEQIKKYAFSFCGSIVRIGDGEHPLHLEYLKDEILGY